MPVSAFGGGLVGGFEKVWLGRWDLDRGTKRGDWAAYSLAFEVA